VHQQVESTVERVAHLPKDALEVLVGAHVARRDER
jgi:hypothetical protein